MKKVYTLPKSRILLLLFALTLTAFSGAFSVSAQTPQVGDYRSRTTGNWTAPATWQYYNGSTWIAATYYPGQATTPQVTYGAVTIQAGHNVTALTFPTTESITVIGVNNPIATKGTTYPIGKLTISGTLTLNETTTYIKTLDVYVTPGSGTINFPNNTGLALLPNAVLYVSTGGLSGNSINATQSIYIGSLYYAIGQSNSAQYTFAELMAGGGTINAIINQPINNPITICHGTPVLLQGSFSGTYGTVLNVTPTTTNTGVTYKWYNGPSTTTPIYSGTISLPNTPTPISTNEHVFTPNTPGTYTLTFRVETWFDGVMYYNEETRTIVVRPTPTATISVSPNTVCQGSTSAPIITFTNTQALDELVIYNINGINPSTINVPANSTATVTVPTTTAGTYTYNLVSVQYQTPPNCPNQITGQTATVTVNPATTITAQPQSQTICPATNNVSLSVAASGTPTLTYQWYSNNLASNTGGTSISGATSATYTFTNNTPGTYYYYCIVTGGSGCGVVTSNVATVTIKQNMWEGTSGEAWENVANWTCKVPGNNEDVIFSPSAANNLVLDQDRTIGSLTNSSSKALIIPTGKALTISGTASNNAPERLVIQSANDAVNGSLIFTQPTSNQNVQASVEMYSKAYRDPVGMIVTAPDGKQHTVYYKWQYFGIPVQSAVYNTVFEAQTPVSYVRRSDETLNSDGVYYNEWVQLYNNDALTPFTGYEITQNTTQAAGKKITFKGALVTGDKTLNLTYTTNSLPESYGSGYNIFGNSFTAAIDINKIQFGNAIDKTVYLYNTGSLYDWYEVTDMTSPGSYLSIPWANSTAINREIPSMQGFMLIANSGFTGTNDYNVTIPYSSVIKNLAQQRVKSANTNEFSYLTADVVGKSGGDRVWLFSQPGTSRKYDNGWDGRKIILNPGFSLYVDEGKDQLQVSTSDNLDKTYLAFRAGKDTEYTLRINKANLTDYQTLYLTDLATKTVVDLSALSEYSHTFTATNTAKAERRFLITSKDKKENLKSEKVKIFNTNNIVRIDNPTDESGTIQLYDMYGQLRFTSAFDASGVTEINTMLPASVYVVRVKSAGIDQSGKIVVSH